MARDVVQVGSSFAPKGDRNFDASWLLVLACGGGSQIFVDQGFDISVRAKARVEIDQQRSKCRVEIQNGTRAFERVREPANLEAGLKRDFVSE